MTTIPQQYQNKARQYANQIEHHVENNPSGAYDLTLDGRRLSLHVNETAIISDARFQAENTEEQGLLEALCRLIKGMPLVEAAEFGAQRLEQSLRDDPFQRNIKGISLPFNLPSPFREINQLLRKLYNEFLEKGGKKVPVNLFTGKENPEWTNLTKDEKKEKIAQVIQSFANVSVLIKEIAGNRVTIEMNTVAANLGDQLMRMESLLKTQLDPGIELYLEEAKDRSAIRRL